MCRLFVFISFLFFFWKLIDLYLIWDRKNGENFTSSSDNSWNSETNIVGWESYITWLLLNGNLTIVVMLSTKWCQLSPFDIRHNIAIFGGVGKLPRFRDLL